MNTKVKELNRHIFRKRKEISFTIHAVKVLIFKSLNKSYCAAIIKKAVIKLRTHCPLQTASTPAACQIKLYLHITQQNAHIS